MPALPDRMTVTTMTIVTIEQALRDSAAHIRAGRLDDAEPILRQVLLQHANNPDALNLLGLIAFERGHLQAADELISRAVALAPGIAEYHNNLGQVHARLGQFARAIDHYRESIRLKGDLPLPHFNLALVLRSLERLPEAEASLRSVVGLVPNDASAANNLGEVLVAQGRADEAVEWLARAITLAPHAATYANLLRVLLTLDRLDEAEAQARKAVALWPGSGALAAGLAGVLYTRGNLAEAVETYCRALTLDPQLRLAEFNLAAALRMQGLVEESIATYRAAVAHRPELSVGHGALLLTLHYFGAFTPQQLFEEHLIWARRHAEPLTARASPARPIDRDPDRRLRIGYVSPDFRAHSIAAFVEPVLALDPRQFEVFCYADEFRSDEVTRRLKTLVPNWQNVNALDDEQLARKIRADRIDILVDLSGHTADNRLLTFAHKPAPVQATYLGYPNTTGMSAMDWRITDALADPIGPAEALHVERLLRLPVCAWCYRPPDNAPPLRQFRRAALPITFGTFNALPKISPAAIALWSNLLRDVPESRLLIKATAFESAAVSDRYYALFESHGIRADRIELIGAVPTRAEHLAMYERIDVALDTFPYNGTTTTCEALWMGVPVVALAGDAHVSRVGVSLLTAAGLPDLIAVTPPQYVQIAAALARDRERLDRMRASLRQTMQASALMDARRFSTDWMNACRQMWRAAIAGPA